MALLTYHPGIRLEGPRKSDFSPVVSVLQGVHQTEQSTNGILATALVCRVWFSSFLATLVTTATKTN